MDILAKKYGRDYVDKFSVNGIITDRKTCVARNISEEKRTFYLKLLSEMIRILETFPLIIL